MNEPATGSGERRPNDRNNPTTTAPERQSDNALYPFTFDIPTYASLSEDRRRLAVILAEFLLPEGYSTSIQDAEVDHYMAENPERAR